SRQPAREPAVPLPLECSCEWTGPGHFLAGDVWPVRDELGAYCGARVAHDKHELRFGDLRQDPARGAQVATALDDCDGGLAASFPRGGAGDKILDQRPDA